MPPHPPLTHFVLVNPMATAVFDHLAHDFIINAGMWCFFEEVIKEAIFTLQLLWLSLACHFGWPRSRRLNCECGSGITPQGGDVSGVGGGGIISAPSQGLCFYLGLQMAILRTGHGPFAPNGVVLMLSASLHLKAFRPRRVGCTIRWAAHESTHISFHHWCNIQCGFLCRRGAPCCDGEEKLSFLQIWML